jgi:hypothetical protein
MRTIAYLAVSCLTLLFIALVLLIVLFITPVQITWSPGLLK